MSRWPGSMRRAAVSLRRSRPATLKQTDVYVFRVAAMLDDFAVHGSVLRRYSRSVSKLSAEQAEVLAGFQAWLRADGCAVSTVRAYGTVAGEFLAFTGEPRRAGRAGRRGDRRVRCDAGRLPAEDGGAQAVRGPVASAVRRRRRADRPGCAGDGPGGRGRCRQARIPSVWDPADVAKVLEAIDRGNPSGKRDYAIVLLICRLGLRAVDVKRLRVR